MSFIRGITRLTFCILTIIIVGILIFIAAFIPVRVGRYQLAFWVLIQAVDLLVFGTNIKVVVPESERLSKFSGFLMPNHVSYIDILVLYEAVPCRFLAKNKIRYWPVVGQVAYAIGCLFVKRKDKDSRKNARETMKNIDLFPPIIIFPEGTRGSGTELLPFRYGGFEIAAETKTPILPLAIVYDKLALIRTHDESIWKAYWRLLSSKERLTATIYLLDEIRPLPEQDPVQLSIDTHAKMNHILTKYQYAAEIKEPASS
ncbi:MAG: lysophospholipid acyltransferase family protein [Chloroflexota bacterium]